MAHTVGGRRGQQGLTKQTWNHWDRDLCTGRGRTCRRRGGAAKRAARRAYAHRALRTRAARRDFLLPRSAADLDSGSNTSARWAAAFFCCGHNHHYARCNSCCLACAAALMHRPRIRTRTGRQAGLGCKWMNRPSQHALPPSQGGAVCAPTRLPRFWHCCIAWTANHTCTLQEGMQQAVPPCPARPSGIMNTYTFIF